MEVIKREFLDKPSVSPNGHAERSRLCRRYASWTTQPHRKTIVHERSELTSTSDAS